MDISIEQLLQIIGSEHVKACLLEEEVGRLRQLVEKLQEEAKKPKNEQTLSDNLDCCSL